MKYGVFIQTNHKQMVGAVVAEYALRRYSQHNDQFDIVIMEKSDYPWFDAREGQEYLRDGVRRVWLNDDLQSFTPLRFLPPELMGYKGRAIVIDPDVFAMTDVWELFTRDMQGKPVACRARSGTKGLIDKVMATSVMLLDCARLTHWNVEKQFNAMFEFELDYQDWVGLRDMDRAQVDLLENEWNDFDRLTPETRMLHTTKRRTQPWKTGLPVDWRLAERFRLFPPAAWILRARRKLFGEYAFMGNYKEHPDRNQENFFFGLLAECLEQGIVSEDFLHAEMQQNHLRHDVFEVLARTPALPPAPAHPLTALNQAA